MPKLPIRPRAKKPDLLIADILAWADAYYQRRGRWPFIKAGHIPETADGTWSAVDAALHVGSRGLPGGDSFAKLLMRRRGTRHPHFLPRITIPQILGWADVHRLRTGEWPSGHLRGQIPKAPKGLTWIAVEIALSRGKRGLPYGLSVAQLLELHRGVRNRLNVPDLTLRQILVWADDHYKRTGHWPKYQDGTIAAAPQETWSAVETALSKGKRGLPGGDSLRKLLARRRGVRNKSALPLLTVKRVRAWAMAHRKRTGQWPIVKSGPILEAPGETWSGVNAALGVGMRGFPGNDSLARLLSRECGKRNLSEVPRLSLKLIRQWVRSHHSITGRWPKYDSGAILGVPGETWGAVANALTKGRRGLSGGMTLALFVRDCQDS